MDKATIVFVRTYEYYKSMGFSDVTARDIASMAMNHYMDFEE